MTLKDLAKQLDALPRVVTQQVAKRAAEKLTALAKGGFEGQKNPYGASWGGDFDLVETGKLKSQVRYRAIGPRIKAVLGTRYARYHVTRVLPGRILPAAWFAAIEAITTEELAKAVK